ncbi:MAG: glycosyltransferase family 4 protein [Candidatus Baldrarchaeia archaeon]
MKKRIKNSKIAFFLGCTNPYPGGGWTRIASLARYLNEKGFQIDVIGIFPLKSLNKAGGVIRNGLRILNIIPTLSYDNVILSVFDIPLSIITLTILFAISRPELLIISVPAHKILTPIGAYLGGRVSRAKIIFDYRDEWEDMALKDAKRFKFALKLVKRLMSLLYIKSSIVLVNSPKFFSALKKREVLKVKIVFTGANVKTMKPYNKELARKTLGLSNNAFIIAYAGLIGGCYRLDIVVNALSMVKERNTILLMIGTGPDVQHMLKLANKINVMVYYLGVKNNDIEIAKALSAADVGIIPYDANPLWKNTIPTKFFEYCACSLPIIATAHEDSIVAELIGLNRIGLVCKPLDAKELAEAIERLSRDMKFRKEAAKRARLFVEQNFDRNRIAKEFLDVIVNLL